MIDDEPFELVERARAAMGAVVRRLAVADPHQAAVIARELRPRADDFDRLFLAPAADAMRRHFAGVFATDPIPAPGSGQTEARVHVALAGLLREDNLLSRPFPGGYRRVAPAMMPLVPWGCWSFVAPGADVGITYDGLAFVDDRVVWLPKPWRAAGRGQGPRVP